MEDVGNARDRQSEELHAESLVIVGHADTMLGYGGQRRAPIKFIQGTPDDLQVDLPRLRSGGVDTVFFVVTRPQSLGGLARTVEVFDTIEQTVALAPEDFTIVRNAADIEEAKNRGQLGAFIGMEKSLPPDCGPEVLRVLHRLGLRTFAPYDYPESGDAIQVDGAGYSVGQHAGRYKDPKSKLSELGVALTKEAEQLGMLIDVTHMPSAAFWHVMEITSGPIIDSHTNAWALCNAFEHGGMHADQRNRRDDELVAIAERGGVIGINAFHGWVHAECGDLGAFVDHIEYIGTLCGWDAVGLGLDLDGGSPLAFGEDAAAIPNITQELLRRGHSETRIQQLLGSNFLRVISTVIG